MENGKPLSEKNKRPPRPEQMRPAGSKRTRRGLAPASLQGAGRMGAAQPGAVQSGVTKPGDDGGLEAEIHMLRRFIRQVGTLSGEYAEAEQSLAFLRELGLAAVRLARLLEAQAGLLEKARAGQCGIEEQALAQAIDEVLKEMGWQK